MATTSSYRAYVTAMKAKINQADVLAARTSISKLRRRKTSAKAGKAIAAIGSVVVGLVGITAMVKFTTSMDKKKR